MKKGVALLTAIIFITIVGALTVIILSSSSSTVKKSEDIYLYEQAKTLAKSATEYAILAIQGHNFSSSCLNEININYQNLFDINITIYYIGNDLPTTDCNILSNSLQTDESNGTAIIDTKVSLSPTALQTNVNPITFTKRTLQKL